MSGYFIGGDIGGTKVLLRAADLGDGLQMRMLCERRYASREYASFSDILADFLKQPQLVEAERNPAAACFAVAGPITEQGASLTNLPWLMNAEALASEFSIRSVKLINDFAAVALSVEVLPEHDLVTLQAGKPLAGGMRVALGAGTGMGGAWLSWQGDGYIAISSEAGHMDFAPADELQDELLRYLRAKFGHVSVERVLSGPGLTHIFNFLSDKADPRTSAPEQIRMEIDDAPRVTELAVREGNPIALEAMDLFVAIYGAYAGNLALTGLTRGGLYVAGGIAPRIIGNLKEGGFLKAFRDKGRFAALMEEIPVHVVMNPTAGLLGAVHEARRMLSKKAGG
ncbi:MAG TPA: glucokinase [Nitrosospira sp.]|nr:glucokinase [Nitrosospira sp.]